MNDDEQDDIGKADWFEWWTGDLKLVAEARRQATLHIATKRFNKAIEDGLLEPVNKFLLAAEKALKGEK